jgi:hypothetical protein
MTNHRAKPELKGFIYLVATLAFILLSSVPLCAQGGARDIPPPQPLGMSERDRNLLDREAQLSMMEKERRRASNPEVRLAFAQIKEDFKRLQIVDLEMMRAVSSGNGLDYKYISDSVREIKKRAARLKLNLVFPEAEKDDKPQVGQEASAPEIKPSLMALDSLILSFVTNPVFKEVGVIDTRLGIKARRDLERIIELSEKVKKSAELMIKNAGK